MGGFWTLLLLKYVSAPHISLKYPPISETPDNHKADPTQEGGYGVIN